MRIPLIDTKTFTREANSRFERYMKRQTAVALGKVRNSRRKTRNAYGGAAANRSALQGAPFRIEILRSRDVLGCGFARIDHDIQAVRSAMKQKETASAESG